MYKNNFIFIISLFLLLLSTGSYAKQVSNVALSDKLQSSIAENALSINHLPKNTIFYYGGQDVASHSMHSLYSEPA